MKEKIMFVASSGGHLEEIAQLKKLSQQYESFLVTEKNEFQSTEFVSHRYYVPQINRKERFFIFKFIRLFFTAHRIIKKENPLFLVTTGALMSYPFCLLMRNRHKKVIYIESFARINKSSLTGRLLYKHADLFIVQWKDMQTIFPDAVLGGGIF